MIVLMQPQTNDYEFILNTDHKPKKKSVIPSGNSKQSRILIVIGGLSLLLIIGLVVMSFINSAGNATKTELVKVAKQQTELVRVSEIGVKRAKGGTARNLAVTTSLSLRSDQAALSSSLAGVGIAVDAKELAAGINQETDATLTAAEQSNKFDEVFIQTLQAELTDYQQTLKSAYDKATNKKLKATLSEQFEHAELLISIKP